MTLKMSNTGLHTIISGGQTGADQGGLVAGSRYGIRTGGCAPAEYKTQVGPNVLLACLGLRAEGDYADRTKVNVKESDGTVIIAYDVQSPGTRMTIAACSRYLKPVLVIDIAEMLSLIRDSVGDKASVLDHKVLGFISDFGQKLRDFIVANDIQTLNVAGNREIRSDGTFAGSLIVTSITEHIVTFALDLLEIDDLIIFKDSDVEH